VNAQRGGHLREPSVTSHARCLPHHLIPAARDVLRAPIRVDVGDDHAETCGTIYPLDALWRPGSDAPINSSWPGDGHRRYCWVAQIAEMYVTHRFAPMLGPDAHTQASLVKLVLRQQGEAQSGHKIARNGQPEDAPIVLTRMGGRRQAIRDRGENRSTEH